MAKTRLELTWYNKDKALIPVEKGKYDYKWVDPSDPRYCETRTLVYDEYIRGKQSQKTSKYQYSERADLTPQEDNLLVLGESGDVLEALTRIPELAEKYVGQVKLIYIDPPFNTAKTFSSYEDNLEHSIWLTMMRDRLLHLKKLLSDEGSTTDNLFKNMWIRITRCYFRIQKPIVQEVQAHTTIIPAVLALQAHPMGSIICLVW